MGYIHCCSGNRRSKSYRIYPESDFLVCEVDYLESCPVCGHSILQITRIDLEHKVSICRKVNDKARKLFSKIKGSIIYEKKNYNCIGGKFYLNYNEFGVKKRCYSNLSTLKIGLFDSYGDRYFSDKITIH